MSVRASARDSGWVRPPSSAESIVAIILIIFLIGFPWLHPGYRFLSLAITTGFTAIALYGLGLQFGQAGIMSVGHAAFMGIGAYTAGILAGKLGIGFWGALPFSVLFSALFAGLIGLPSLRVSGQHYIIITFCFCALLNIAFTNGGWFTGGATGLDVGSIDSTRSFAPLSFQQRLLKPARSSEVARLACDDARRANPLRRGERARRGYAFTRPQRT